MDHGLRIRGAADPSLSGNVKSLGIPGGGSLGLQEGFHQFAKNCSRRSLHKHRSGNPRTFICGGLSERPLNYLGKRIEPLWALAGASVRPQVGRSMVLQEQLSEGLMTMSADITIQDGQLLVYGEPLLRNVPSNVVFTSDATLPGGFLGASFSASNSHHVAALGVLEYAPYSSTLESTLVSILVWFSSYNSYNFIALLNSVISNGLCVRMFLQGCPLSVLLPLQAMVDDAKNGLLWARSSIRDAVHALGRTFG